LLPGGRKVLGRLGLSCLVTWPATATEGSKEKFLEVSRELVALSHKERSFILVNSLVSLV